jgi:hypothetical protein
VKSDPATVIKQLKRPVRPAGPVRFVRALQDRDAGQRARARALKTSSRPWLEASARVMAAIVARSSSALTGCTNLPRSGTTRDRSCTRSGARREGEPFSQRSLAPCAASTPSVRSPARLTPSQSSVVCRSCTSLRFVQDRATPSVRTPVRRPRRLPRAVRGVQCTYPRERMRVAPSGGAATDRNSQPRCAHCTSVD